MKIKILGGGWYGCSIAEGLQARGLDVHLFDHADRLFNGASGSNPARLHQGQHYPRSKLTRAYCQEHNRAFLEKYGRLTRGVPINLYAIASDESLVDFGTYKQVLKDEIELIEVYDPAEYGLRNVEGAILTGERHIVIDDAREYFQNTLRNVHLEQDTTSTDADEWDWIIDCTFCARDSYNIERFEPCVTYLLSGPTDKAVTVMDGPFPSIYPWNESLGLCSMTSAKWTPIDKCQTWGDANKILQNVTEREIVTRGHCMMESMEHFWPEAAELYDIVDHRLAIRAMPKSAADARLVDIVEIGKNTLRVRAGKIDAVIHAESLLWDFIDGGQ